MATAKCNAISAFFTAASSTTTSSSNFDMSSAVSFAYLLSKMKLNSPFIASENALVVAYEQDVVGLHGIARVKGKRVLAECTEALQDRQIRAELARVRRSPRVPGSSVT
jgi:hypothetical protein